MLPPLTLLPHGSKDDLRDGSEPLAAAAGVTCKLGEAEVDQPLGRRGEGVDGERAWKGKKNTEV